MPRKYAPFAITMLLMAGCTTVAEPKSEYGPTIALQGGLSVPLMGGFTARGGAVQITEDYAATVRHSWFLKPSGAVNDTAQDLALFPHAGTPRAFALAKQGEPVTVWCNGHFLSNLAESAIGVPGWAFPDRNARQASVIDARFITWSGGDTVDAIFLTDETQNGIGVGCSGGAVTSAAGRVLGMLVGQIDEAITFPATAQFPAETIPAGSHVALTIHEIQRAMSDMRRGGKI